MKCQRVRSASVISAGCVALSLMLCTPVHAQRLDLPLRALDYRRDLATREATSLFTAVGDLEVTRAGHMYVLNPGDQTIVLLDARGKRVREFGRRGEGPGEFRRAGKLAIRRDSVWVVDYGLRRVTRFALNGQNPVSFLIQPAVGGVASPAAMGTEGVLVAVNVSYGPAEQHQTTSQSSSLLLHTDYRGNVSDTLLRVTEPNAMLRYSIEAVDVDRGRVVGNANARQPFTPRSFWSVNYDGSNVVVVAEEASNRATAVGSLRVTSLSLAGDTLNSRRLPFKREPVTAQHVTAVVDSLSRTFTMKGNVRVRGNRQTIRDSLDVAAFWPAVSALTVGVDGSIWIRRNGPPGFPYTRYWVVFPNESEARAVTLPREFTLLRASRSALWGWSRDPDGLPVVERYRLIPSR